MSKKPNSEVIQDVDLIKIKTIKEKHVEQLLDDSKFSEADVELLYPRDGAWAQIHALPQLLID
jgi:hypothetical protein